jgi:endonuclease-3 related protein
MNRQNRLLSLYSTLLDALGPSHWWPGESPFEVAVGAILTQNTNWANVERAIAALRGAGAMTPAAMRELSPEALAGLIRPAGTFRVKAARLGHFLDFLAREAGSAADLADASLRFLAGRELSELRPRLLAVKGVGPETADCILLYALNLPSFVVDAYTARIMSRHLFLPEDAGYDELQAFFADVLPADPALFGEFHALIVRLGKTWCGRTRAKCETCPLHSLR